MRTHSNAARIVRTVGTVKAGVYFFSPSIFQRQEPRRQQRKRLMMMPANPIANLILGEARIALGPPKAFFNPMLRLCNAGELAKRRLERSVRQVVIVFHRSIAL